MSFASKSEFQDIQLYFQIPEFIQKDEIQTSLKIWIEPTDFLGQYVVVIQRATKHSAEVEKVALSKVPEDVENLIYGFFHSSNTIRIQMILPSDFPIRPPKFAFLNSTHDSSMIKGIVHQFECDLSIEYSPALAVEKTLLILLSRLLEKLEYL